ncbi:MAG: hypothetical protein R3D44_03715 [Hyphomicrobiaceae bacterium]
MLARSAVILTLASVVAGCANDAPNLAGFASTTSALAIATPAVAPVAPGPTEEPSFRKTMSDRILTAIALERVTGLKPDPGRLAE